MPQPPAGPHPLPRSTPREQGVDARGVLALVDALEAAPAIEPHSLMVLRHGQVVAEGWWHPWSADGVQLLYSLSKSFTSAAVGLAVAEGLLSLDDTVLSHFPELEADVTDPRVRRLLVRHVAAMAAGHESEAIDRAEAADPHDLLRGFLLTPPEREPGSLFAYSQPCTYALAAIVVRRSGGSLLDYLRPRLLDPLGITDVAWTRDDTGREIGYSGLHATTDAVARLGLLHLQGGEWEGHRLLPGEWVAEATRAHVPTSTGASTGASTGTSPDDASDWERGYGFQFWQSRHGYRGDGAYGQFCLVLPEQDAVVAMTAATEDMQAVLDAVWEHLLPALGSGATPGATSGAGSSDADADADADAALADRLRSLALAPVAGDGGPAAATDGWDGLAGRASGGDPIASAALDRDGDAWSLTLTGRHPVEAATPLRVEVGLGAWALTPCPTPEGDLPVAVSGAWAPDGALHVVVAFLETPHSLGVTLGPDGALTSRWLTEPLGDPPLTSLRAPRR